MKLLVKDLLRNLKKDLEAYEKRLPVRIAILFDELKAELKDQEKVDLFELMVRVMILADKSPAQLITNLLVPIDHESIYRLDDWTVSNSAAFLRDFMKKDDVLCFLEGRRCGRDESPQCG